MKTKSFDYEKYGPRVVCVLEKFKWFWDIKKMTDENWEGISRGLDNRFGDRTSKQWKRIYYTAKRKQREELIKRAKDASQWPAFDPGEMAKRAVYMRTSAAFNQVVMDPETEKKDLSQSFGKRTVEVHYKCSDLSDQLSEINEKLSQICNLLTPKKIRVKV